MNNSLTSKKLTPLRRIQTPYIYEPASTLGYRAFNRGFFAIEQCAEYLADAQLEGDYLEFGVYRWNGMAFTVASC